MFRFTIRDVLWLTALVAVGVGWWADHRSLWNRWARAQSQLVNTEEDLGSIDRWLLQFPKEQFAYDLFKELAKRRQDAREARNVTP
jgi:hypothetical protein